MGTAVQMSVLIIQHNFQEHRLMLNNLAASSPSVTVLIVSPVVQLLLSSHGWSIAFLFILAFSLVPTLPVIAIVMNISTDHLQKIPEYGVEATDKTDAPNADSTTEKSNLLHSQNTLSRVAYVWRNNWRCLALYCGVNSLNVLTYLLVVTYVPLLARELGQSSAQGTFLVTCVAIGDILLKPFLVLLSLYGTVEINVYYCCSMATLLALIALTSQLWASYVGLVVFCILFGSGNSEYKQENLFIPSTFYR